MSKDPYAELTAAKEAVRQEREQGEVSAKAKARKAAAAQAVNELRAQQAAPADGTVVHPEPVSASADTQEVN